ncbi:MAG: hypothetical protein H7210_07700, partial [Pyrinomonadaceae bacterium]|nr:hypothetical protein [Phycisphaerales bacterium]
MVYDSSRGVVVIYGGMDPTGFLVSSMWDWNGTAWQGRGGVVHAPRPGQAVAIQSHRRLTRKTVGSMPPEM